MSVESYTAVLLVPTGIGCAIGGYAGDAIPVARAIAQVVDCLITHPNVVNGAQLYWPLTNTLYVEGYALDRFASGAWALQAVRQNRVGLVLDRGIETDLQLRHLQAAEATRATLGLNLTDYVITDQPLQVRLTQTQSGASWGTIDNLDTVLRAADKSIHQAQAQAIAVVTRFPDDAESEVLQQYRQGRGVDPIAGAEAIISHTIVRTFQIPCAHAPALVPLAADPDVSPRAAAEELGYTFLPCVLVGLSRAPRYHVGSYDRYQDDRKVTQPGWIQHARVPLITTEQVDVVITPASACGGPALLQWATQGTVILAVEENTTTLSVPPEALGIPVVRVRSYLEAIGFLASHRAGINPIALTTKLSGLDNSSFPA